MGHCSLSSPLPNFYHSASPYLWGSVLRELVVKVPQCLHDSRRALHIGVVDHDVTCQQVKDISATAPLLGSLRATRCQALPWTQGTLILQRDLGQSQAPTGHSEASAACPFTVERLTSPTQLPLPNTSEGFNSSSKWPPRLVSYVAKPPSEFLMLSNWPDKQREGLGLAHKQYHPSWTSSQV